MGFDTKWVSWIMACVKSVKFSVQVNGQLTEPFTPSRGLRQGDPLSPYLFLLIAESLTKVINRAVQLNKIKEFKIRRVSPGISHLLFDDDRLLFFQAYQRQALEIKEIISTFKRSSSQLLSVNKFSILFSYCCSTNTQEAVRQTLQVSRDKPEQPLCTPP